MKEKIRRKIILEDGREFYGYAFGSLQDRVCEIVFNTSMAGYQEILSDLSYTDQAVVMTYPLIGNYGMAAEDYESCIPSIGAMIVREYNDEPSNFRSRQTLGEVMEKNGIPGITGVDTRALTRSIRDYGTRKALLADASMSTARGLEILQREASGVGHPTEQVLCPLYCLPRDASGVELCRLRIFLLPQISQALLFPGPRHPLWIPSQDRRQKKPCMSLP